MLLTPAAPSTAAEGAVWLEVQTHAREEHARAVEQRGHGDEYAKRFHHYVHGFRRARGSIVANCLVFCRIVVTTLVMTLVLTVKADIEFSFRERCVLPTPLAPSTAAEGACGYSFRRIGYCFRSTRCLTSFSIFQAAISSSLAIATQIIGIWRSCQVAESSTALDW